MLGFGPVASAPVAAHARAAVNSALVCDGGTFSYAGGAVLTDRPISLSGVSLSISGGAVSAILSSSVTMAGGTFPDAGGACSFKVSFTIAGASLGFAGGTVQPVVAFSALGLSVGTITLSGATLGFPQSYALTMLGGSFAFTAGTLIPHYWEPATPATGSWLGVAPTEIVWAEVQPF